MKKVLVPVILSALQFSASAYAKDFILTDTAGNIEQANWQTTSEDLGFPDVPSFSVAKKTLHGGKQEGVDVIEVDNGRLRFVVIPTRGMSILKVESGDVRLGWDSPVKEVCIRNSFVWKAGAA